MRVVFVARYLQEINQKKIARLSQAGDIQLWHLVPDEWHDAFNRYTADSRPQSTYQQLAHGVRGSPDIHRFYYWPPPVYLRAVEPDIIHVEEEPDSLAALEFSLLRAIWAPRAQLVLFTWQNVLRRTNVLVKLITRFNLSQAAGLLCGNQGALSISRYHGFRGLAQVVPQLGVEPADFAPVDRQQQRQRYQLHRFTVGYVGRLALEKGLDLLCEAVEPLSDVQLLLAGDGPLAGSLAQRAQAAAWNDRMRLTGSLTHAAAARLMGALDVLILPSRTMPYWKEQFGHVLIEAMAAGVPVIGSDSGAIPEVIGQAGLVFPEGSVTGLRECLERLRKDADLRADLAARGRARVLEHYTHDHIAAQTAAFYRTVLAARR